MLHDKSSDDQLTSPALVSGDGLGMKSLIQNVDHLSSHTDEQHGHAEKSHGGLAVGASACDVGEVDKRHRTLCAVISIFHQSNCTYICTNYRFSSIGDSFGSQQWEKEAFNNVVSLIHFLMHQRRR